MVSTKDDQYKSLCAYCFDALDSYLNKGKESDIIFPQEFKGKSYPIFVTWTTGANKELRGCVGTFASGNLEDVLLRYALIAAVQDTRFPPITKKEFPNLNVGVSLLTNFEDCKDPMDWTVGTHGIEIDFKYKGKDYGATFLPEVALEEKWDQKMTLAYLLQKSGFKGRIEEIYKDIHTQRYQSTKTYMSNEEYKKLRNL